MKPALRRRRILPGGWLHHVLVIQWWPQQRRRRQQQQQQQPRSGLRDRECSAARIPLETAAALAATSIDCPRTEPLSYQVISTTHITSSFVATQTRGNIGYFVDAHGQFSVPLISESPNQKGCAAKRVVVAFTANDRGMQRWYSSSSRSRSRPERTCSLLGDLELDAIIHRWVIVGRSLGLDCSQPGMRRSLGGRFQSIVTLCPCTITWRALVYDRCKDWGVNNELCEYHNSFWIYIVSRKK